MCLPVTRVIEDGGGGGGERTVCFKVFFAGGGERQGRGKTQVFPSEKKKISCLHTRALRALSFVAAPFFPLPISLPSRLPHFITNHWRVNESIERGGGGEGRKN